MIFLEDLLTAPDFQSAVDGLAREFRAERRLPPVHQLGLVVPDAEAAAEELEKQGIGPFFIAAGAPVFWRERSEERSFQGKLGMAGHKGFELELLEPGMGSDFYRSCLDCNGKIVVQHLGFLVDDVDAWADGLAVPVYVRGRIKTGPLVTEFVYMDTMEQLGIIIEFINWSLFGISIRPRGALYHALGRFEKLIGKRSLSV
ncbi:MAG: VOC family protein [Chloroflexi bacterium]|nr:VOC family protein [Chloroflexota bacterium]